MSTIDLTTMSEFAKIPLLRRIIELVEEREQEFSRRSLAKLSGINRETLRQIFSEKQQVTLPIIKKIATGLGVSVDRLRQLDTVKREVELKSILNGRKSTKVMLSRAFGIATELVELAQGVTERGFALNNLGRVLYLQEEFNKAHETWQRTLEYAKLVAEGHNEPYLLHIVTANLMLTYTIRKEYSNIEEIFKVVEEAFPNHPKALGQGYYTKMKMEENRGNHELAREYSYKSLEHFTQTNDDRQIGIALLHVAHCEFILGNYKESARLLSRSIDLVKDFDDILIHGVKEYVKSLMKLRDHETAIRIVDQYSELATEYPEFRARLRIMYSVAKDEPAIAENVMRDTSQSVRIRYIASKCLFEYYYRKGDSEIAMRYYENVRIYSNSKNEYLDEEGL